MINNEAARPRTPENTETRYPEFKQLLQALSGKKALRATAEALIKRYPHPVRSEDLSNKPSSQLNNNLVELRVARIRKIIQENQLPVAIVLDSKFGYHIVKSSEHSKPWWSSIDPLQRHVISALLEKPLTRDEVAAIIKDISSQSKENTSREAVYTTIFRIRKALDQLQIGSISSNNRDNNRMYSLILASHINKKQLKKDLAFALNTHSETEQTKKA